MPLTVFKSSAVAVFTSTAAKAVAGSYKSAVTLTLSDGSEVTTENLLTVKVGKTLPKLKAAAVKLNRFIEGQEVPVVVTGGRVSCVTDCVPDTFFFT